MRGSKAHSEKTVEEIQLSPFPYKYTMLQEDIETRQAQGQIFVDLRFQIALASKRHGDPKIKYSWKKKAGQQMEVREGCSVIIIGMLPVII